MGGEVDVGDGLGDMGVAAVGGGAAGVEDRGEVVEVLADGQVVVDRGAWVTYPMRERSAASPAGRPRTSRCR